MANRFDPFYSRPRKVKTRRDWERDYDRLARQGVPHSEIIERIGAWSMPCDLYAAPRWENGFTD